MPMPAWAMTEITGDQLFAVLIGITLLMSLLASFWWCLRRSWYYRPRDFSIRKVPASDQSTGEVPHTASPRTQKRSRYSLNWFLRRVPKVAWRSKQTDQSEKRTAKVQRPEDLVSFNGGWILSAVMAVSGIIAAVFWQGYVGAFILAVWATHLATCLHEVRDPNEAFLFQMGRCVGRLSPGWYLTIPHIWSIALLVREWTAIHFSDPKLYTADKPARRFEGKGVLFFRPMDISMDDTQEKRRDHVEQLLLMPHSQMREKGGAVALAELRRLFGSRTEVGLIKEKKLLEKEALLHLQEEFGAHGYEVRDYEITRMIGADAETRARGNSTGYANKRMAEPLKGNYPGAIGLLVSEIGRVAERLLTPHVSRFAQKATEAPTGAGTAAIPPDLERQLRDLLGQSERSGQ